MQRFFDVQPTAVVSIAIGSSVFVKGLIKRHHKYSVCVVTAPVAQPDDMHRYIAENIHIGIFETIFPVKNGTYCPCIDERQRFGCVKPTTVRIFRSAISKSGSKITVVFSDTTDIIQIFLLFVKEN